VSRAKVLRNDHIQHVTRIIALKSKNAFRDVLMLRLSFQAGLRAQEIALLYVEDVTDVAGKVESAIQVTKRAAKFGRRYGKERRVPMAVDLQQHLAEYIWKHALTSGPIFFTQYGRPMTANAVEKQLKRMFQLAGLVGASSHSGRRTFITRAAFAAHLANCTLKDVQHLAGHSDISTTELYIEESPEQAALVAMLYSPQLEGNRERFRSNPNRSIQVGSKFLRFKRQRHPNL